MLKSARLPFCAIALLLVTAGLAAAQSPLGIGSAEPSFQPMGGPLAPLFLYVNQEQQAFYRALTGALRAMRQDPWQLKTLIGLSFAYGIFHAAGPGHGKAVISSYMLANEIELKRGIVISFVSAFLQGIMAVVLVGVCWLLLRGTGITLTAATHMLEIASFILVIMFGAWLLFKKLRALWLRMPQRAAAATTGPVSMMLDWQDNALRGDAGAYSFGERQARDAGHRFISGMACETCGKSHMPDPTTLGARTFSLRDAWSAIIAVGLRPCSGAILVMTFSLLNGLYFGGILSVAAMSVGTAITVAILAIIAVSAKDVAIWLSRPESRKAAWIANTFEILGALMVILMGILLLGASLQA